MLLIRTNYVPPMSAAIIEESESDGKCCVDVLSEVSEGGATVENRKENTSIFLVRRLDVSQNGEKNWVR